MCEVGAAFVVLRPGALLSTQELIDWSYGQLANFKVPRHVDFVDELPYNAIGKIQKAELRQRAATLWGIERASE
jgi:acyl-coenzyme A synthetase/AMP-(fatty) acid ligase